MKPYDQDFETREGDPLGRVLQDGGDHAIPPEIMARARRRLDGLRERMEARETMNRDKETEGRLWNWRRTLAWATPAAALVLLAVLAGMIATEIQGAKVYAAAVQRIRNARSMLVSLTTNVDETNAMKMEVGFLNTGVVRIDMPNKVYSIVDAGAMRSVTVDPNTKVVVESTLKNMPKDASRNPALEIQRLRSLPERASEALGEKVIDGRRALGYRVIENDETDEVWIDAQTRELVQVVAHSKMFPNIRTTMSNFRFDVAFAPGYFSTAAPAGYKRQQFNIDLGNPAVEDYLALLRFMVMMSPDETFPESMDPMKMNAMSKEFMKRVDAKKARGEKMPQSLESLKKTDPMKAAQSSARGMLFLVAMKPENDWHYVGGGVKLGEAKTPIAWWRPTGSKNYKVIYGDLTVKEEPPEAVPTPPPSGAGQGGAAKK